MDDQQAQEKSCGLQLLTDQPSHSWDLDQLSRYAQEQHQMIVDGEKRLAPTYWRLGQALSLARKQFHRGQWDKFLKSLDIERTRAARARAIFNTFSTAQEVEGKSVEEAYGRRTRRQKNTAPDASSKSRKCKGALRTFLNRVPNEAEALVDVAAHTEPTEARRLLVAVEKAIQRLEQIRDQLQKHADSPTTDRADTGRKGKKAKVKLSMIQGG